MLLILILSTILNTIQAQEIDPTRFMGLPDKVRTQLEEVAQEFPQRKPSTGDDFREMVTYESIHAPLEKVWQTYTTTAPNDVWVGPLVNFVLTIDKENQAIHYYDDSDVPAFYEGMMILNYLNFLGHYILVGHQVIAIDHENKKIELAYLEGNASRGTQILEFEQKGKRTKIKHTSLYKSSSAFRDRILYPIFHRLTANEYHRYMRRMIIE